MSFSVGSVKVRLTLGALFCFVLCVVLGEGLPLLLSLLALSFHEAAHWIAAINAGRSPQRLAVYPFGAVLTLPNAQDARGEWVIALSGPLASLLIASLTKTLAALLPDAETALLPFARTNLMIGALNLLPAFPLDGGRVAKTLLLRVFSERAARRLALLFTAMIASGLFGAGVWLLLRGVPAWTLLVLPPHLLFALFREWEQPSGNVGAVLSRRAAIRSGSAEKAEIVVLSSAATVGDAIAALSRRRFTILRVTDGSRFVEIGEDALLGAAAKFGYAAALKDTISVDRAQKTW